MRNARMPQYGVKPTRTTSLGAFAVPLSVEGDTLPTRFRLFKFGENPTDQGVFTFDEASAASVMVDFERRGVDLMIDLQHDSVKGQGLRADEQDARGWARLEVVPGDGIYCVDVKWTPDGARRLLEKTQRYISPTFLHTDDGHVEEIINCGLVSMPGTFDAPALVAASRGRPLARNAPAATLSASPMDPEQIKAAIDALTNGTMAKALGLDGSASPQDILDAVQAAVNALGPGAGPADSSPDNGAPPDPSAEGADKPAAAMMRRILSRETNAEALETLSAWAERIKTFDAERAALESSQRAELVGELVKLGAETPATAWDDVEKKTPAKRFLSESVDDLRGRVTKLRAARGTSKVEPPAPPKPDGIETLSKAELDACKRLGRDPADYLERKKTMLKG